MYGLGGLAGVVGCVGVEWERARLVGEDGSLGWAECGWDGEARRLEGGGGRAGVLVKSACLKEENGSDMIVQLCGYERGRSSLID